MNQEQGFLHAIADDPADDTSRLVYADWLEERGAPRAEIIRLEHTLGSGPREDPRRLAIAERLAARGNKAMADYIRSADAWRQPLERRLRQLLPGVGAA